jgi:hypothetical protein
VSAVSDLFARSLIDTYVTDDRDFVERPSVDAAVRGAVADPNCRFLLITGSPGTGKTALMAEGMEWLSVVRTTSPVLPRLGRVGDPDPARPGVPAAGRPGNHQLAGRRGARGAGR